MIQYQSKDFKKMMFPLFDLGAETDLLKEYPILSEHPVFASKAHGLKHNLVLRYVFYCYDKNSKIVEISDLIKRKEAALKLAGFDKISPVAKRMMSNKIPAVNDMIVAFCRMQNNRLFQMKLTALEAFHEYQRLIIEPIDEDLDDDKIMRAANLKTKLIEDCDLIHGKINKYSEELYGSIEDAQEMEAVVRVSPENISKMAV